MIAFDYWFIAIKRRWIEDAISVYCKRSLYCAFHWIAYLQFIRNLINAILMRRLGWVYKYLFNTMKLMQWRIAKMILIFEWLRNPDLHSTMINKSNYIHDTPHFTFEVFWSLYKGTKMGSAIEVVTKTSAILSMKFLL